jgi:uncharacterized damage-inducible protein DinB
MSMKQYLTNLANYNIWANNLVFEWLSSINEEQWSQQIESSFSSIKETCIHVLSAEHIWHQRLTKVEAPVWIADDVKGSKDEVIQAWRQASDSLLTYVSAVDESQLSTLLFYKRINGESYTQPLHEILIHVFNHSTYHRGQLVTMLRQVGYKDVTATDYLLYSRLMEEKH